MEYTFETVYGQKATTAMARTLRKTLRRKHSRRSHIFGWIVAIFGLLLTLPLGDKVFAFNMKTLVTYLVILILFLTLLFEDRINGYIARKRMLKGTEAAKTTFGDDGYFSETEIGNTEWKYDKVVLLAETKDYFVFVFSNHHAQVYDKKRMEGGTAEQFRDFIQDRTNKKIIYVK